METVESQVWEPQAWDCISSRSCVTSGKLTSIISLSISFFQSSIKIMRGSHFEAMVPVKCTYCAWHTKSAQRIGAYGHLCRSLAGAQERTPHTPCLSSLGPQSELPLLPSYVFTNSNAPPSPRPPSPESPPCWLPLPKQCIWPLF